MAVRFPYDTHAPQPTDPADSQPEAAPESSTRVEVKSRRRRARPRGWRLPITDGPFAESKELIGGFAVMDLSGMEETIAMCRRYAEILGGTLEIDVRPLADPEAV